MTHVIHDIIQEIDPEVEDELTFDEFWQMMLHLRMNEGFTRGEVKHFMDLFEKFDGDGSGGIGAEELLHILRELGYFPEQEEVNDALADIGVNHDEDEELDFDGLWRFLEVYRGREGFSKADIKEIREVFNSADTDGT